MNETNDITLLNLSQITRIRTTIEQLENRLSRLEDEFKHTTEFDISEIRAKITTLQHDVKLLFDKHGELRRYVDTSLSDYTHLSLYDKLETRVKTVEDKLNELSNEGIGFNKEEVSYLRQLIERDKNDNNRHQQLYNNSLLQRAAEDYRDARDEHEYGESFFPAREVFTVDEFHELLTEFDEEVLRLSEFSTSYVKTVMDIFKDVEYTPGLTFENSIAYNLALDSASSLFPIAINFYYKVSYMGVTDQMHTFGCYIELDIGGYRARQVRRTFEGLGELDQIFLDVTLQTSPNARRTAEGFASHFEHCWFDACGVLKHNLVRDMSGEPTYKKPTYEMEENNQWNQHPSISGLPSIDARKQQIPATMRDGATIRMRFRDYNDFDRVEEGWVSAITNSQMRHWSELLHAKIKGDRYVDAIYTQINAYGAHREELIEELKAGSLDDNAFASVSIAQLMSAVDDLVETAIRYEERVIDLPVVHAALYPTRLSVPFTGYSHNWYSQRASDWGLVDGDGWGLNFNGLTLASNTTSITLATRDDSVLPAIFDYTISDDEEFWVILRMRSSTRRIGTGTTPLASVNLNGMFKAQSNSSFLSGLYTMIDGDIPLGVARVEVVHEILELIVIDKQGVAVPIFDSLAGTLEIAMHNTNVISVNLANAVYASGDIVIAGARYNAIFVDVVRTISRTAFESGSYLMRNRSKAIIPTFGGVGGSAMHPNISNAIPGGQMMLHKQYYVNMGSHHAQVIFNISIPWGQCLNGLVVVTTDGSNNILGTTWALLYPRESSQRRQVIREITPVVRLRDFSMRLRVAAPPDNVGVRRTVDTMVELLDLAIETERMRIDEIENDVQQLTMRLDVVERQIDMVYDRLNPSFTRQIISVITDMLISVAIPLGIAVIGKATLGLMRAARPLLTITSNMLSTVMSKAQTLRKQIRNALPVESIGLHMAKITEAAKARGRSLKSYMPVNPGNAWNINPNYAALFPDVGIELAEQTMFVSSKAVSQIRREYDGPLNNFSVFARPFDSLPPKVSQVLFSVGGPEGIRRQNLRLGSQASNKRPLHTFGVHRDYTFNAENGKIRETVTLIGAGEPGFRSRVGVKEGINGVQIAFEYDELTHGIWNRHRLSHTQMGYTSEQLRNTFESLYSYRLPDVDVNDATLWRLICWGVDDRIKSSRKVDDFYFGSKYTSLVLRDILNNPPDLPYHLFRRNCQNLTNELAALFRSRPLNSDRWGLDVFGRAERLRYSAILADLDGLSSVVVRALISLSRT